MTDAEKLELEFLRYFYDRASEYMEPCDCDIYDQIAEDFKAHEGALPEGYGPEEYEDDE